SITLGSDNDLVHFVSFSFAGSLKLHGGSGNDAIDFTNCSIDGPQKLFGDDGDDSFVFDNASSGKVTILGGNGKLTVNATDSGYLLAAITGGSDDATVTWDDVFVDSSARFTLKQGNDTVQLTGVSVNTDTNVNLSVGDNQFTSTGCSFGEKFKLTAGNGQD